MFLLLLLLFTTTLATVLGDYQQLCTNYSHPSLAEAFDWVARFILAREKFDWRCILDSCPELANPDLCPYDADQTLNSTAVNQTISAIATCFQTGNQICGHPLNEIPFPTTTANYLENYNLILVGGKICTFDDYVKVSNLHKTHFKMLNFSKNPPEVTLQIDFDEVDSTGILDIDAKIQPINMQYLLDILPIEPNILSIAMPLSKIPVKSNATLDLQVLLNLSNKTVDYKVLKVDVDFETTFFPVQLPLRLNRIPFLNLLTNHLGKYVDRLTHDIGHFYATYVVNAMQAAVNSCP